MSTTTIILLIITLLLFLFTIVLMNLVANTILKSRKNNRKALFTACIFAILTTITAAFLTFTSVNKDLSRANLEPTFEKPGRFRNLVEPPTITPRP